MVMFPLFSLFRELFGYVEIRQLCWLHQLGCYLKSESTKVSVVNALS